MPTFIANPDGTYSEQNLVPFDPLQAQAHITVIAAQITQLQTENAALQQKLTAFNQQFPNAVQATTPKV
jgi:hypothetical protein